MLQTLKKRYVNFRHRHYLHEHSIFSTSTIFVGVDPKSPPKCDLHVHSTWSDGVLTIEDLVHHADLLDLEVLAVTDHYPAMGHRHASRENPLEEYFAEITQNKPGARDKGVRLLAGLEFDVTGEIGTVPLQSLDLLLIEGLGKNPAVFFSQFFPIAHQVRKVRGRDFPLIIAHPFFGPIAPNTLENHVSQLEKLNVMIELNTSYRNFVNEAPTFEYLAQATELRFSIGSDAHNGTLLGQIQSGWGFLQRYNIESRFFLAQEFGVK